MHTKAASVEAPTLRNTYDVFLFFPNLAAISLLPLLMRLATAAARPSLRLGRLCRPWLPCY